MCIKCEGYNWMGLGWDGYLISDLTRSQNSKHFIISCIVCLLWNYFYIFVTLTEKLLHKRYFSNVGRNSRAFEQKDRLASKVSPPLQLERAGWHKVRYQSTKGIILNFVTKITHFMKIQGKWGKNPNELRLERLKRNLWNLRNLVKHQWKLWRQGSLAFLICSYLLQILFFKGFPAIFVLFSFL